MAVRNLMEDIVRTVLDEVLRNDRTIAPEELQKEDILAYVLNRVTPTYVTSERGILHGRLDNRYGFQVRSDIFFLIYEAMQTVGRRSSSTISTITHQDSLDVLYPHILGQVLESTTFSIIPGVEVTLLADGRPLSMVDEHWKNPYRVSQGTMGYYHFWPASDDKLPAPGSPVRLELQFRHKNCMEQIVPVEVNLVERVDLSASFLMPLVLMQVKEGVPLDFLYEK